jgi:WXG100 family type VII secretion target
MAIKFDYNQTINQAKALDEATDVMYQQCLAKLEQIGPDIGAAWTGEASKAFQTYINGMYQDLLNKSIYMRDLAEFLRDAAKKMKAAEEAAKQAAGNI